MTDLAQPSRPALPLQTGAAAVRTRFDPQRGFTLVEMMVVVAMAAILLAVAVPSFAEMVARMRLEGMVHNLATDLQLARAEAIQRRAVVNLVTTADGSGYSLTSGGTTIKTITFAAGVAFTGGVTVSFDPLRGLANAATLTSTSTITTAQLRVTSDVMGRVQMCSPSGGFKGYSTC